MIPATLGEAGSDRAFCRVISPAFAGMPLSGQGAARQGGRFNRPGPEALYLSAGEATALAEYRQDNPWLPPGTICTFFVNGMRVADLSEGFDAARWPALWADFAADWRAEWFGRAVEPPTRYMADDVIAAGMDGLLFPSQARPGGINLVVYAPARRSATQLRVYDPEGVLRKLGR